MKHSLLVVILLLVACGAAYAQAPTSEQPFAPVQFLAGDWVGEGEGGTGSFSFHFDVQNSVLVRRNHAEYPASETRPAIVHDDLMVIFREGADLHAIYWDNEKHVIRYAVTPIADGVEFISDAAANAPRFRLTYRKAPQEKVEITFEIAPPGQPFKPYLTGHARRVTSK